jgi:hypothetical protein
MRGAHRLIRKLSHTHRYQVTYEGRTILNVILLAHRVTVQQNSGRGVTRILFSATRIRHLVIPGTHVTNHWDRSVDILEKIRPMILWCKLAHDSDLPAIRVTPICSLLRRLGRRNHLPYQRLLYQGFFFLQRVFEGFGAGGDALEGGQDRA